ncbi:MAG: rhomboid family intramembrane serine protease [Lachnospiraceae bacterium]|nr:rhomboid family intramembrane serine protease [Lachnospiraceae bacterium]
MKKSRLKIVINSPVILTFVLISFIATFLNELTGGTSTAMFFMTYHSPLTNPLTWLRFFTHVFGHSGWDHLIGNMTYLLLLGPMLEEKYGSADILEVIAVTALVTGLVNYIFFPNVALCGASGVVFALILLSSIVGVRQREIPLTFILVAVIFLGQQVYEGLTVQDNISNMAHIVGGITGSVFGYILNKKS